MSNKRSKDMSTKKAVNTALSTLLASLASAIILLFTVGWVIGVLIATGGMIIQATILVVCFVFLARHTYYITKFKVWQYGIVKQRYQSIMNRT
jgi:membrane protein YdbS with pleckstrin-like domain